MTDPPDPLAAEVAALRLLADRAVEWLDAGGERLATVVPEISKWSPRMHVDHAALATLSIFRAVERILAGDPRCLPPGPPSPKAAAILTARYIPRGVAEAPDPMRPAPDVTHAAARDHLVAMQAGLDALAQRSDALRKATTRLAHFELGPMTPAEWIQFARIHFDHHAAIARDLVEA